MVSSADDLSIEYMEDGVVTVKQLDKVILSKGAWVTILYKYQDWEKAKNDYGPVRFSLRRYQKRNNEYKQQSRFNISSVDQAQKIIDSLNGWIEEDKATGA